MPGLGDRFRAAREARSLSLSEVSEQVRIRSVYLAAIEEGNWKAIGAAVYTRGFLRTYARFLGLDPEEVVSTFNQQVEPPGSAPEPAVSTARQVPQRSSRPGSLLLWVAGAVAVLLVALVAYNALTMRREVAPVAGASTSPPVAETSAAPSASLPSPSPAGAVTGASPGAGSSAPGAAGPQTLALVLSAPSWLRVTVDGSVSIEGTFPAGTTKTFHGKNALVRVGNAGGVEIFVDGKNVGKLGKSGDVVERAFTL